MQDPEPLPSIPPNPDAARKREVALREVLDLISRSREDDAPVFEVIVRRAALLCEAGAAALVLGRAGDAVQRLAAQSGMAPESVALYARGDVSMNPDISLAAQAILTGKTILIPDMMDTDGYRNGVGHYVSAVHDTGVRTELFVPLVTATGGIGAFLIYRNEVRPFDDDEIALVETFAAQAVIAIENARQFRELQTRLEREAATKNVLRVISESPDDEQPTFEAILDSATRLCGTEYASLVLGRSGDASQRMVAHRSAMDETLAFFREGKVPMDPDDSIAARAILEGRTIHVPDMADTEQYRAGHDRFRLVVDRQGLRTNLFVPLLGPEGAVGCFILWKKEVAPFTADQIALMETFASHAVIAIENVRQFRELETRLEREKATAAILDVISQSRDDERPVFDVILRNAANLCKAPIASLILVNEAGSHLVMAAMHGETVRTHLTGDSWPMDPPGPVARSIRTARIVHMHDLSVTDEYRSGLPTYVRLVDEDGLRTDLSVPLVRDGVGFGAITLSRRVVDPFDDADIALIQAFAAQAVIAIENVRQFRELQTRLEREAATRDILEVISQSRDDDVPVFDMIARSAARLCGAAICTFWRVEDGLIHYCASHGLGPLAAEDTRTTPSMPVLESTLIGQVVKTQAVVRIEDGTAESYYDHEWARAQGLKQLIGVPIFAGGGVWGSINLMWPDGRAPGEADIQLVESFANQASIAIENVRQFRALEALNAELGKRVEAQVGEIERMGRLKRFLPAAVADAVVSSGSEKLLSSHRALLGVLFCDIRGFTAFCETAEPEETIEVLQTYHDEMGRLINAHGAGVDHRMGDGIMVLFNDPLPCDDPAGDAVRLALAMRQRMAELCGTWKRMGHKLGFGLGVSLGYATVGMVGSGGRFDYTASGTAINLAARLCEDAQDGEILISPRTRLAVEGAFTAESRGEISFKGIRDPVEVFCVIGMVDRD